MMKNNSIIYAAPGLHFNSVNTKRTCSLYRKEKSRRIQEEEQLVTQDNPARAAMMNVMNRVQRQMLLQKFKGKWVSTQGNR